MRFERLKKTPFLITCEEGKVISTPLAPLRLITERNTVGDLAVQAACEGTFVS